ncbi:MAG: DUF4388 domain-containing protein [bacterium]|nr:DUF4388 domain-containing protein [bacterium]
MTSKLLKIDFETQDAFESEFHQNISKGGVFIETDEALEMRECVEVELRLIYCKKQIRLAGEVVHVIPPEMAPAGASPGVALHLETAASDLRKKFEGVLGQDAEPVLSSPVVSERRSSMRSTARVTARVKKADTSDFVVHTRDISETGVSLSAGANDLEVGAKVELEITDPLTGRELPVRGEVVREMVSEDGEVGAVGIQFEDGAPPTDCQLSEFVDDVTKADHSRSLGSVSGEITKQGIVETLEMFGTTAPQGTLILRKGPKEGSVALLQGYMLAAANGKREGIPALAELLSWRSGTYSFETHVADDLGDGASTPLAEALTQATALLERAQARQRRAAPAAKVISITSSATVHLEPAAQETTHSSLGKTEQAILDLAVVGMAVGKMKDVIPEADEAVDAALHNLLEQDLITLD